MEEKFRIDDVEYTVHAGPCFGGEDLLCAVSPESNAQLLSQWMAIHPANTALRNVADTARPVAGACDDTVIRQLAQMACDNQLSVTKRMIASEDEPLIPMLVKRKQAPAEPWFSWGEKGSDPLGLGFWETHKIKDFDVDPDDDRHKLAVEIAATRQATIDGELVFTSDQNDVVRYDFARRGVYGGHRLQAFYHNIPPGRYHLNLRLKNYGYGSYDIPITIGNRKVPSCPKPLEREQWETVLVPLVPRTYTTIFLKRDVDHADYPPAGGYIYIFLDGHLWREVLVEKEGWFRDVHLTRDKGKDLRPAHGRPDRSILTPYLVQGYKPKIEIGYSQTQWSWAQIEALGGMAPDDPRLALGPALKPVDTGKFPFKRLQPVDLSCYPNFENGQVSVGHCRQKGEVIDARRKDLRSFFDTGMAVVYLHNALGIAESLVVQYHEKLTELRQVVADLPTLKDVRDLDPVAARAWEGEKEAYYRCAIMAYRVFFDPETTRGKPHGNDPAQGMSPYHAGKTPFDLGGSSLYRRKTSKISRPKIFDTCMKELNRKTLENVLQVTKRRDLRADMRQLKKTLVGFLQDQVVTSDDPYGQPAAILRPDFVPVNAMLADYSNLNGVRYGLLWKKAEGIFGFLNHEPCTEDPDLDIAADIAAEKPARPEHDQGYAYLSRLFDPSHPLCPMLWPTQDQVDHARADYQLPSQTESADGQGLFRQGAFYHAAEGRQITDRHAEKEIKDLAKIVKQSVAHMVWVLKIHWGNIKDTKSDVVVCTLVRLLKATGDPNLEGLHVLPAGSRIDLDGKEHVVLGAGQARFNVMSKADFMKQRPGSSAMAQAGNGPVSVRPQGSAVQVAGAPAGTAANYTDEAPKITRKQWKAIWGKAKTGGEIIYKARVALTVMPTNCRYAISYYNAQVKSVAVTGIKATEKAIPPVIAVMEMLNFGRATLAFYNQFESEFDAKITADWIIAGIASSYYTLSAAVAIAGKVPVSIALGPKVGQIFSRTYKIFNQHIVIYNAIGAGVTMLSALASAWDSVASYQRDDRDAAAGFAVASGTLAVLSLAKFGMLKVTVFAGLAPWSVPLLTVGIVATVAAFMLTDSDLEKWSKHGPFALAPDDRWRYEYKSQRPKLAIEALMGALLKPTVTIKYSHTNKSRDKHGVMVPDVEVSFYAPGYLPDSSELIVDVTAQRGQHADGATASVKKASGEEDYRQHFQLPHRQEPIVDPLSGQTVGFRYLYHGLGQSGQYRWRVRARHITQQHDESLVLPPLLGKSENHSQQHISSEAPGWVYADT